MTTETQIKEYSKTEAALAELKTQLDGVVFDCTTPAGLKEAKDSKMLLVRVRTGLEKIRVEIKGPALERCNLIDSEARRIRGEVEALENPILYQIQKEIERKEKIKQEKERKKREEKEKWLRKLLNIKSRPLDFVGAAPDVILDALNKARAVAESAAGHFPEELQEEAKEAFAGAIKQMEQMHIDALNRADLEKRAAAAPPIENSDQPESADKVEANDSTEAGPTPSSAGQIPVNAAPPEQVARDAKTEAETITHVKDVEAGMATRTLPPKWENLWLCAKAVCDHYGKFKKPHKSIVALQSAIENIESV